MLDSKASATIDQSTRIPDLFSCVTCAGYEHQTYRPFHRMVGQYGWVDTCIILREEGRCKLDLLKFALEAGAVTLHLHLGAGAGTPWQVIEDEQKALALEGGEREEK